MIIVFSLPGLISKTIAFLGVDDLAGGALPPGALGDDDGAPAFTLASLTGTEKDDAIVFEMGQNDMEERETVVKHFEALKPLEDFIHEIKGTLTHIAKKMHETELDDEEDNIRTRTVTRLFQELEDMPRFDESCIREEIVKELYVKWTTKIDGLLLLVQKNLPRIKKAARKRRKEKAAAEEKARRIRMGLDDDDEDEEHHDDEEQHDEEHPEQQPDEQPVEEPPK